MLENNFREFCLKMFEIENSFGQISTIFDHFIENKSDFISIRVFFLISKGLIEPYLPTFWARDRPTDPWFGSTQRALKPFLGQTILPARDIMKRHQTFSGQLKGNDFQKRIEFPKVEFLLLLGEFLVPIEIETEG